MAFFNVCVCQLLLILNATLANSALRFSTTEENSDFRTLFNLSLKACRKECAVRPACTSVNYFWLSRSCDLNKMTNGSRGVTGRVKRRTRSVHSKKTDWSENISVSCGCPIGQKCVSTNGNCVFAECARPTGHTKANMLALGAKSDEGIHCLRDLPAVHSFGAGFEPATFPFSVQTCSSDGSWKMTTPPSGPCHVIVFIIAPGTNTDPYIEWQYGTSSPYEPSRTRPYRSHVIDTWEDMSIAHVRLSISKNLQEVQYVLFNGTGSTKTDWFSGFRLINSSWKDLLTSAIRSTNIDDYPNGYYFSLAGHEKSYFARRFFINRYYGGCVRDIGWLAVVAKANCDWTRPTEEMPVIVYSKISGAGKYTRDSEMADYVYITLCIGTC